MQPRPEPKDRVLTIFCFGTNERRDMSQDKRNFVSQFSEQCDGPQPLVLDGPQGIRDTKTIQKNVTLALNKIADFLSRAEPTASGTYKINMTGFSRGAVTLLRIANALKMREHNGFLLDEQGNYIKDKYQQLIPIKKVKFNLFAVDPVAGLVDKGDLDAQVIPDNVQTYKALIQQHEGRREFEVQDFSRMNVAALAKHPHEVDKTTVELFPFYGSHTDIIRVKSEKTKACTLIAWQMLYQFLTEHGTEFKNNQVPSVWSTATKKECKAIDFETATGLKGLNTAVSTTEEIEKIRLDMVNAANANDFLKLKQLKAEEEKLDAIRVEQIKLLNLFQHAKKNKKAYEQPLFGFKSFF